MSAGSVIVGSQRLMQTKTDSAPLRCVTKRFCRQVVSCEEARFHLSNCGLARIDGDGDGMPCKSLCSRKVNMAKFLTNYFNLSQD
jgi:hypothetical protein